MSWSWKNRSSCARDDECLNEAARWEGANETVRWRKRENTLCIDPHSSRVEKEIGCRDPKQTERELRARQTHDKWNPLHQTPEREDELGKSFVWVCAGHATCWCTLWRADTSNYRLGGRLSVWLVYCAPKSPSMVWELNCSNARKG